MPKPDFTLLDFEEGRMVEDTNSNRRGVFRHAYQYKGEDYLVIEWLEKPGVNQSVKAVGNIVPFADYFPPEPDPN